MQDISTNYAQPVSDPKAAKILQEKVALLHKEFADIDVNHDAVITKEELFRYLDLKAGKQFDPAIANEIWEQMDKSHANTVTLQEFVKVYIEADEILTRKIDTAKENKEYYKKKQEECLRKAEEAKQTERLNINGIMDDSFLDVSIIEARGLRASNLGGPIEIFIEVSLEGDQINRTKISRNISEPKFDDQFTFNVFKPNSELRFAILDSSKLNKNDFEGEVIVVLEELKDQNIHDVWLDLFDKNGNKTRGQLHVKLQWIHSKVIYNTLYAQKWFDYYKKEDEELQEYEKYLQSLHEPFVGMRNLRFANSSSVTTATKKLEPPGWMDIDHHVVGIATKMAGFIDQNPSETFWQSAGILVALLGIIFGIFICYARGDFIDVIVPLMALFYLRCGVFKEVINLKTLAWALFISWLIIDLPWLWIYTRNWAGKDLTDSGLLGSVKLFTIIITYINFFFKLVEGLIYYMLHIHLSKLRAV